MNKEFKKKLMSEYAQNEKDTGSVEVQIALLTSKIKNLTQHFATHKKDFGSKRGLFQMVNKRKKYLQYLEQKDMDKYRNLIDRLGIRK